MNSRAIDKPQHDLLEHRAEEVWLPIPCTDGGYEASSLGRIRSLPRVVKRGGVTGGDLMLKGKIMRPTTNKVTGYEYVTIYVGGKPRKEYVHRLVLSAHVGECPKGYECLHSDGVASNNALHNISWGTRSHNTRDRFRLGEAPFGELCSYSKLTDEEVSAIRSLRAQGEPSKSIARQFGINACYVNDLVARRARKRSTADCLWKPKS